MKKQTKNGIGCEHLSLASATDKLQCVKITDKATKVRKIAIIALLLLLSASFLMLAIVSPKNVSAEEKGVKIAATENKIKISGSLTGSGKADIIKLRPYEYFGKNTLYHNEAPNPIKQAEIELGKAFSVEFDRYTAVGEDKAYDKFGIVQNGNLIGDFKYATEIESLNSYDRIKTQTKKGLQVQNVDDAFKLGVQHAAINYKISEMLYQNKPSNLNTAIEFKCGGKTYYFKKNEIEKFDADVIALTDNNVEVTIILIMPGGTISNSVRDMVHPKFEGASDVVAQTNGTLAAPNLTDDIGMEYWQAACEFTASRYTREDMAYGRVSNVVVGNEVDVAGVWNNMGDNSKSDYIDQYVRTLRATHTAFKKYYDKTNILVSLTHAWNTYALELPSQYEKKLYRGKDIVDGIAELTRSEGDFFWGFAYHPYPSNLRDPRFWLTPDSVCNDDPSKTQKITFKNLKALSTYLNYSNMKYNGETRPIYLTEQGLNGFSSKDKHLWPSELGQYSAEKAQKLQAVAYAYSYYLINQIDEIKAYILHRHIDATDESRPTLSLGLWTCDENGGQADPIDKKVIYDVFKYIDTDRSLEFSQPLLEDGFIKTSGGSKPSDWKALIKDFDETKLAVRKDFEKLDAQLVEKIKINHMVDNFEKDSNGWRAAEYTKSVDIVDKINVEPKNMIEGKKALRYTFESNRSQNGGYAEKGIIKTFDKPLDISKFETFNFSVNVPNGAKKYIVTALFYSGFDIKTATIEIEPNKWNNIQVDLSKWSGNKSVDKIKIWLNTDEIEAFNKFLYVDSIGFEENITSNLWIYIAIGCAAVIVVVIAGLFIITRRRKKRQS